MKNSVAIALSGVAVFALCAVIWLCLPCRCVSERELLFYYPPMMDADTNGLAWTECSRDRCGVTDAMFHMRSAIKEIRSAASRRDMVEKFLLQHSEYSNDVEAVSKAFERLNVELCAGTPSSSLSIRVETTDLNLSRNVALCFADAIIGYFKDEGRGLFEKMSAWFEGQKTGREFDEVKKIEGQERIAFANARRKCLQVILSTNRCEAVKTRRLTPSH